MLPSFTLHCVIRLTTSMAKRPSFLVFGEVAEGLEILSKINEAYVDDKNRPYKNIRIRNTYILYNPFVDLPKLNEIVPDASPGGKPKDEINDEVRLEDDWVPMDEQLCTGELEVFREEKAHSCAVVLESIGDIPDADIKPPENVIFVCNLNPETEDTDLKTIFSQCGIVTSAEIIRDHKIGESFCYAFIDDRRIHVDFSQSVSELSNQYKPKANYDNKGGKGCFKCGSVDHILKECTSNHDAKQHPKYIIRNDIFSRKLGYDNSRYDMVFDKVTHESPQRKKRPRHHKMDDHLQLPKKRHGIMKKSH